MEFRRWAGLAPHAYREASPPLAASGPAPARRPRSSGARRRKDPLMRAAENPPALPLADPHDAGDAVKRPGRNSRQVPRLLPITTIGAFARASERASHPDARRGAASIRATATAAAG